MNSNLSNSAIPNQLLVDLVSKLEKLNKNSDNSEVLEFCKNGFKFLIDELTHSQNIQFSTFFSQLAFAASTHKVVGVDLYMSHLWRKYVQSGDSMANVDMRQLGMYVLFFWCKTLNPEVLSSDLADIPGDLCRYYQVRSTPGKCQTPSTARLHRSRSTPLQDSTV